jgi:hypothetical protein
MKTHWVAYLIGSLAKVAIKADPREAARAPGTCRATDD